MQRRNFLRVGVAGMALSLARGPVSSTGRAEGRRQGRRRQGYGHADLSVVVIGTDGNDLLDSVVDDYLAAHADVWHFMPNLAKFSQALEFIDKNPKIVLAKTTSDILAAKRSGKVAMVIGWQDSAGLTDGNGADWRSSNPPKTKLREYYELGLRTANLTYQLSNQFGGGMLDPDGPSNCRGQADRRADAEARHRGRCLGSYGRTDRARRHRHGGAAGGHHARQCAGAE